jgi:DNA-binding protein H-NS
MTTYRELLAQKKALDEQIAEAEKVDRADALDRIRASVADFGFTVDEIFGKRAKTDGRKGPQAPKFRDPATGNTWSGRGRQPQWLTDENMEQFRIDVDFHGPADTL